jgi:hypothetical protein
MRWSQLISGSLLCGAVLWTVGAAFHWAVPLLAPQVEAAYGNEALFRPWEGWTRLYMMVHPWLYGTLFTAVFLGARSAVGAGKFGGPAHGLAYGVTMFSAGALPIYVLNLASFQVPVGVIVSWAFQGLCQYALAGLALGWYWARAAR